MNRRPRPPSGTAAKPPSGSKQKPNSGERKNADVTSHTDVQKELPCKPQEFGLNITGADLHNGVSKAHMLPPPQRPYSGGKAERRRLNSAGVTRVQFTVPDTINQDNTYDLHENPLPDAVFITDLPHDPHFHGYRPPGHANSYSASISGGVDYSAAEPPSLDSAFNALSEQISSFLSGVGEECNSNSKWAHDTGALESLLAETDSGIDDSASKMHERRPKPILKRRPFSATTPRDLAAENLTGHEFLVTTRPHSATASAGRTRSSSFSEQRCKGSSEVMSDVSGHAQSLCASLMEPVVYSLKTGKQIGGVEYQEAVKKETKAVFVDTAAKACPSPTPEPSDVPSSLRPLLAWCVRASDEFESPSSRYMHTHTHDTTANTHSHISAKLLHDVTGFDTSQCLVLLPCLHSMTSQRKPLSLPEVPSQQSPRDDLNGVKTPAPKRLIKTRRPIETVECAQARRGSYMGTPRIRVYAGDGHVLHETSSGPRCPGVVRREIQELEDFMKGIGSTEGCLVVQMQEQINKLNSALADLAPRLHDIDRREAERLTSEQPTDTFGMRAFYRQHDDVMKRIRHQHRLCVLELSDLEAGLGEEHRHFTAHPSNIRPRERTQSSISTFTPTHTHTVAY